MKPKIYCVLPHLATVPHPQGRRLTWIPSLLSGSSSAVVHRSRSSSESFCQAFQKFSSRSTSSGIQIFSHSICLRRITYPRNLNCLLRTTLMISLIDPARFETCSLLTLSIQYMLRHSSIKPYVHYLNPPFHFLVYYPRLHSCNKVDQTYALMNPLRRLIDIALFVTTISILVNAFLSFVHSYSCLISSTDLPSCVTKLPRYLYFPTCSKVSSPILTFL